MADPLTLKNHTQERRIFTARLVWLTLFIFSLTLTLLYRYYSLQISRHAEFITRAEANRIHTQSLPPIRGLIFDRNGEILADNQPSFSLALVPEKIADLNETITTLQSLLHISDAHIEKFHTSIKQRGRRPYEPVPLRYRLNDEEIAIIAVNEFHLPGVEVQAQLVRYYPRKELFAHSLGYVGSINQRDLQRLDETGRLENYEGIYTIGKVGIERVYETPLLGKSGAQNVETNARGRVLRVLESSPSEPGSNLTLFLDSDLQQIAVEALGDHRGSVVAIEIETGGVLVSASTPAFDPNLFVTGISYKDYNALRDSWKTPLFNRVLQGQYPPGSTVKPFIGLAGLNEKITWPSYTVEDPGFYQLPDDERLYRDWKKGGHGDKINLKQAIAQSCDTYFYDLAYRMGIDRIAPALAEFGLGKITDIDQSTERPGLLPTRDWKRGRRGLPWFPGDTLNIGIGQGDMLTTPLQLANATATLARKGTAIKPHILKEINGEESPIEPYTAVTLNNDRHWDFIFDTMEEVVHGVRGTAKIINKNLPYRIAGKTGTAQVIGIKQDEEYDAELVALRNRDHALFIAFAPIDDPKIAVAVVVENGEHGSSTAAPIARKVMDGYLIPDENEVSFIHAK